MEASRPPAEASSKERPGPIKQIVTGAAAFVAFAATAAALMFEFFPGIKPDPPPESVGATVQVYAVEPGVSLGTWLKRVYGDGGEYMAALRQYLGPSPSPQALGQLNNPGELVYVRVSVDGLKHRAVYLQWKMYDLHSQLSTEAFTNNPFPPIPTIARQLRIDAPSRRSVQLLWIPSFSDEDRPVYLRVELDDTNRGVLAVADSAELVRGLTREPPLG
jgi:hypothetical protein